MERATIVNSELFIRTENDRVYSVPIPPLSQYPTGHVIQVPVFGERSVYLIREPNSWGIKELEYTPYGTDNDEAELS